MTPRRSDETAPEDICQGSAIGLEGSVELQEYSIARRPVGSRSSRDAQEARRLVDPDDNRAQSPTSTLNPKDDDELHSHYYDTSDTKRSSRKFWSINSLPRRWTPGQYDHSSHQMGVNEMNRSHMRRYSYRKARSQILVPGLTQLLITCILTAGLAGTFYGYSRKETLDTSQRHVFNFLMTGLIIALTINLTSSMRSYVQVLRWRLLAATSLTLEELDLALDCASQTKTLKLLLLYSWKERKWTRVQVFCIGWILLNLISAIVTGLLGLTQEFGPVTALISQTGPVLVVDLTAISSADSGLDYGAQEFAANAYGVQGGQDYVIQLADDALTAMYPGDLVCHSSWNTATNCIYANQKDDFASYRLNIINAQELKDTGNFLINKSDFYVKSTAVCTAYDVLNDPQGFTANDTYFNYTNDYGDPQQLYVETWADGCVTYISESNSSCGPRCTRVLAVQVKQSPNSNDSNAVLNITTSTVFDCNNTVSHVYNLTSGDYANITFPDTQAELLAGAIGWTGFLSMLNASYIDSREYHLYSSDSYWSPSYPLTTKDKINNEFSNNENNFQNQPGIEALIQQFSMYAFAALDDNGPATNITSPLMPIASVQLIIKWKYAIPNLIGILALQFVFLVAVVLWANKAVIRSDSILSTARLLMPLLDHLKNGRRRTGSVLSGEDIARTHPETDARFFYGYERFGDGGTGYSAEIIKETDKIKPRGIRNFPDGDYH